MSVFTVIKIFLKGNYFLWQGTKGFLWGEILCVCVASLEPGGLAHVWNRTLLKDQGRAVFQHQCSFTWQSGGRSQAPIWGSWG